MWKVVYLIAIALIFRAEGCTYKDAECPDYTIIEKHDEYEIRKYNPITWATTSEVSSVRRIGQYTTFMRLFRYINGQNDRAQKMAMTVPVRMKNTETENGTRYEMSFMVPHEFALNPPVPNDTRITVSSEVPTFYAVRTFNGYIWQQRTWEEEALKLRDSVKGDETVDTSSYYQVGYDAPFDLYDRRNEIWMIKETNQETNEI